MNKNRIILTESQLRDVIKEAICDIINESSYIDVKEIVENLYQLEDKLIEYAQELKRVYFDNERWFDKYGQRYENMGLDNPLYSYGSQGELSDAFDKEKWDKWTKGKAPSFEENLKEAIDYYSTLQQMAESEGYGSGAASRGFDVTKPSGLIWTISAKCLRVLRKMEDISGVRAS